MATSKVPMSTTEDLRQVAGVLAGEILWGFVVTGPSRWEQLLASSTADGPPVNVPLAAVELHYGALRQRARVVGLVSAVSTSVHAGSAISQASANHGTEWACWSR
jgi:hypothetical protein